MVVSRRCSVDDLWGWALLRDMHRTEMHCRLPLGKLNSKETKGLAELSHMCTVPHYTDSGNLTGNPMVASWNR